MLLLRVYEQWRVISFLGDYFSSLARGRKLCVLVLVYLGSSFVGLCRFVLVCGRQLIFLIFCRRRDCWAWGYWCPFWGHLLGFRYTVVRRCLPIVPWSWLFPGTLWSDMVPWQTLTELSGFPPLCVRIPVSVRQIKVCLPSVIWLSFERWLLFFEAIPRPCSLVCHVLFLIISPVGWWFPPRCAPGRGLWPSAIVSLWHFWIHFSVWGMSERPYELDGGSHCHEKVLCVLCKNVYPLSEGCLCVYPPLSE